MLSGEGARRALLVGLALFATGCAQPYLAPDGVVGEAPPPGSQPVERAAECDAGMPALTACIRLGTVAQELRGLLAAMMVEGRITRLEDGRFRLEIRTAHGTESHILLVRQRQIEWQLEGLGWLPPHSDTWLGIDRPDGLIHARHPGGEYPALVMTARLHPGARPDGQPTILMDTVVDPVDRISLDAAHASES